MPPPMPAASPTPRAPYAADPEDFSSGPTMPDYVAHLWRRRWVLVALAVLTLVLAYLAIRFLVDETYQSTAQVFVRPHPRPVPDERDEGIRPPAFRALFLADSVLAEVRERYNEGAVEEERIKGPFERFKQSFEAETRATVDTTIRTEFSPVIDLTVEGPSAQQAYRLTNLWLDVILERYGDLITDEARTLAQSTRRHADALREQLRQVSEQRTVAQHHGRIVETQLNALLRQLTSAPLAEMESSFGTDVMTLFQRSVDAGQIDLRMSQEGSEPGLFERRAELQRQLSTIGADENSTPTARLEAALRATEEQIAEVESRAERLAAEAARHRSESMSLGAEEKRLENALVLTIGVASQAEANIRPAAEATEGESRGGGSLMVLAEPVMPERRIFPPRTALAAVAAAIVAALAALLFIVELYVRRVTQPGA